MPVSVVISDFAKGVMSSQFTLHTKVQGVVFGWFLFYSAIRRIFFNYRTFYPELQLRTLAI